jgi:hypothetical protein
MGHSEVSVELPAWLPSQLTGHAKAGLLNASRTAGPSRRVSTVHLLSGLLAVENSLSFKLFRSFDVALPDQVGRALATAHENVDEDGSHAPSPEAKAALELAVDAANRIRCELGYFVGCGHVVAGLIREPAGVSGRILRSSGLSPGRFESDLRCALVGYGHAMRAVGRIK